MGTLGAKAKNCLGTWTPWLGFRVYAGLTFRPLSPVHGALRVFIIGTLVRIVVVLQLVVLVLKVLIVMEIEVQPEGCVVGYVYRGTFCAQYRRCHCSCHYDCHNYYP